MTIFLSQAFGELFHTSRSLSKQAFEVYRMEGRVTELKAISVHDCASKCEFFNTQNGSCTALQYLTDSKTCSLFVPIELQDTDVNEEPMSFLIRESALR